MSHIVDIFSINKRFDERLKEEQERLRVLKIRSTNRIWRQSTQIFEDLIQLHVRTPSARTRSDQTERFEIGEVASSMVFQGRQFPNKSRKNSNNVITPVIEVIGSDAFCTYNGQSRTRKKLPLATKTRQLLEKTKKISRSIESLHDPNSKSFMPVVTTSFSPYATKKRDFFFVGRGRSGFPPVLAIKRNGASSAPAGSGSDADSIVIGRRQHGRHHMTQSHAFQTSKMSSLPLRRAKSNMY